MKSRLVSSILMIIMIKGALKERKEQYFTFSQLNMIN
jgi:hypothetical protein